MHFKHPKHTYIHTYRQSLLNFILSKDALLQKLRLFEIVCRKYFWGKTRPTPKADSLIANFEPIIRAMWEP
jgi:hypothetical protein